MNVRTWVLCTFWCQVVFLFCFVFCFANQLVGTWSVLRRVVPHMGQLVTYASIDFSKLILLPLGSMLH